MKQGIVLFGELLLRLDPEGFARLVQADRLHVRYTGGEANAGAALAGWGHDVRMVSRVPANELGQACVNYLGRYGIDARHVQRAGDRLGLFYVEMGAGQRKSQVIYDRAGSAFATFSDEGLDWAEIFRGVDWFHFTGTAPAVAPRLVSVIKRACAAAKTSGAKVSCDLNYRSRLWTASEAGTAMAEILPQVDVFVCGVEDAVSVLSVKPTKAGASPREAAIEAAFQLSARFGFSHVAVPMRESHSATANGYAAMLYTGGQVSFSRTHEISFIVDRIGAGDAMTAGLIHGIGAGWSAQKTIDFAAAAGCLKHSVPGDFNLVSENEVESLAAGDDSGRIQR